MAIYTAWGYALLIAHTGLSAFLAPPELGLAWGLVVGMSYLLVIWLLAGLYLPEVMHMGIAHRAVDFEPWFIQAVTLAHNLVGIYVDPRAWVNRHRHHHAFSDHPGDPNKLSDDGFWKTLYLCVVPYPCRSNLARDAILDTWPMRLASSSYFAVGAQLSSYLLLWALVRDGIYALALWCSVRLLGLWANMIQNYWTHDRRFGTRRYDDEHDNAMNIGDWLPVTVTFSACLQNNHHHHPQFLRLSHAPGEYDFGFLVLRALMAMRLVKPSSGGVRLPADVALTDVGL